MVAAMGSTSWIECVVDATPGGSQIGAAIGWLLEPRRVGRWTVVPAVAMACALAGCYAVLGGLVLAGAPLRSSSRRSVDSATPSSGPLHERSAAGIVSRDLLEVPVMPIVTVLDDEYMSLWYHPETGIVHHRIRKYLLQGGFRKLLTASAELLEAHLATKYVSDDRGNVVVDPEDIRWADDNWYPRAVKAGLKHWALVLPSTMVGTLQARTILEKRRRQGLDVEGFDSIEAAVAWLQTK